MLSLTIVDADRLLDLRVELGLAVLHRLLRLIVQLQPSQVTRGLGNGVRWQLPWLHGGRPRDTLSVRALARHGQRAAVLHFCRIGVGPMHFGKLLLVLQLLLLIRIGIFSPCAMLLCSHLLTGVRRHLLRLDRLCVLM